MEKKRSLKKFENQTEYDTKKESMLKSIHVVFLKGTKKVIYYSQKIMDRFSNLLGSGKLNSMKLN